MHALGNMYVIVVVVEGEIDRVCLSICAGGIGRGGGGVGSHVLERVEEDERREGEEKCGGEKARAD